MAGNQIEGPAIVEEVTDHLDKTLRTYSGLYHDLPREPEKEEIFAEVANWVLGRC